MKKISLVIFISLLSVISYGDSYNIIKIGLQYGPSEERKELVSIENNAGFEFGEIVNDTYVKRFELDKIHEFKFDIDNNYHVAIGPFNSYEEALNSKALINNGFIVVNNNYYVYSMALDVSSANNLKSSIGGSFIVNPSDHFVIAKNSNVFLGFYDDKDYVLCPKGTNLLNTYSLFNNKYYRGGFGAKRLNTNDINLINYVTMDEYLYGVLPKEMGKNWPLEALKAQAVVARSFANASMCKFSKYGFNLDNTTSSQVYGGYSAESDICNRAVNETSGKVIKYNNKIATTFFHSSSGGFTANSENVFSAKLPYIRGKYDPYSYDAPNSSWEVDFSHKDIERILNNKDYDIGSLKSFYISEYSDNNRVLKANFVGTKKEVVLPKQKMRSVFGYRTIKSMLFSVISNNLIFINSLNEERKSSPDNLYIVNGDGKVIKNNNNLKIYNGQSTLNIDLYSTNYKIVGSGWGHGLGMSQWGAKKMAEEGFSYVDILKFYYEGTYLE